jgi:hypothetical protein
MRSGVTNQGEFMARVDDDYSHMAARCVLRAADTTDEQHKSVLLRAAAKLNELAEQQGGGMRRHRRISTQPLNRPAAPP